MQEYCSPRRIPVEQADVLLAVGLDANGNIGGFDEGPLEIVVDVAAGVGGGRSLAPSLAHIAGRAW